MRYINFSFLTAPKILALKSEEKYTAFEIVELEKLIDIAKDAGALGAKLTGGGGGGNMVALAEDKKSQKKIHDAITEAGYRAYQTSFGEQA